MSRKAMIIAAAVLLAAFGVSTMLKRAGAPSGPTSATLAPGELEVMPAQAYANSQLSARVAGARGLSAEVDECAWYRNGVRIPGVTGATLEPSHFVKGDEIVAEAVTAPGQPARRSQPVRILGSRPQIMSAMPSQKGDDAEVSLNIHVTDNDGDAVTYQYAWFRNGAEIPGASSETLDVSGFQNGDRVHARIVAHDGAESSAPFTSSPIVLGSDAPAITSTPPSATSGGRYVYQVTTTAHEPGSLSFELIAAPAGMTIDEHGLIAWELPQEQTDVAVHDVAVRVAHSNGGEAVQRFKLTTGPMAAATN